MKNSTLIILLIVALFLLGILFLIPETDDRQSSSLDISGFVFSIEDNRILIAEGLSDGQVYEGEIDQLKGDAYWITLTEETRIFDSHDRKIDSNDLSLADEVNVALDGFVMESYPAQSSARGIRLTGESYEAESKTVGYILAFDERGRVLVAEDLSEGVDEYTGSLDELEGEATWFSLTEAEVVGVDGQAFNQSDLDINMEVEVYSTGPFLLSYPAQGEADKLIVTGGVFNQSN